MNRCALRLRVVILLAHGLGFSVLFTSFQCSRALLQNLTCNKRNQRNAPSKEFLRRGWGAAGTGHFIKIMFFKMICFVIRDSEHTNLSSVTP